MSSCQEKLPKGILKEEKFIAVLKDILRAEKEIEMMKLSKQKSVLKYHTEALPMICEKHQIKKSEINNSLTFYAENVENGEILEMLKTIKKDFEK